MLSEKVGQAALMTQMIIFPAYTLRSMFKQLFLVLVLRHNLLYIHNDYVQAQI